MFKKIIVCSLFFLLFSSLAEAQEIEKIGDDLSRYAFAEDAESHVLKAPVDFYKEPRSGADTIALPAGTTVLFGVDSEGQLAHHYDNTSWYYVMDENKTMIGWATDEELQSILY